MDLIKLVEIDNCIPEILFGENNLMSETINPLYKKTCEENLL